MADETREKQIRKRVFDDDERRAYCVGLLVPNEAIDDLAYLLEEAGRLREALRRTDALMWEWGGDTGHDEEPDGTWRPPSVRERHRLNAELLNEGAALAREDGT